jgi:hypothetical protein
MNASTECWLTFFRGGIRSDEGGPMTYQGGLMRAALAYESCFRMKALLGDMNLSKTNNE